MKNSIIFISNAIGGIKTSRDILIKFIIKNKIDCILIDKSNSPIITNKLKYFKINVLNKIYKTFKVLKKLSVTNKKKKSIFIFSNPVIFVIYFFFIKFLFKRSKIFFFVHSHLTKKKYSLKLFNYISSFLFIFIDSVFYVSKFTKKWWQKEYYFCKYASSSIQYNSIQIQKRFYKKLNKKFRIGFVGRLSDEKGLQKFIDIAYNYKDKFTFNIFSNEKLILKNSQKKYINFYFNKHSSLIYKNIDLLLVTSPIENCPFNVLEAKAHGIPTLAYLTKGGISEIIENNFDGIIIKDHKNNLKFLAQINNIKKNYKFFSNAAYKNSKKYNADIEIKKLIVNKFLK